MGLVFDRDQEVMLAIREALMQVSCERALAEKYGITQQIFLDDHRCADVVGLEIDGQIAGGMFFIRGQVHIGIAAPYRWRWCRSYMRPMLEFGFERQGPSLMARVYTHNRQAQAFIEHAGCRRRLSTALFVEYEVIKGNMIWDRQSLAY